jgi:hypothetical protein
MGCPPDHGSIARKAKGKRQKAKRQKAKIKNKDIFDFSEPHFLVFIFAFCLLPFDFPPCPYSLGRHVI